MVKKRLPKTLYAHWQNDSKGNDLYLLTDINPDGLAEQDERIVCGVYHLVETVEITMTPSVAVVSKERSRKR